MREASYLAFHYINLTWPPHQHQLLEIHVLYNSMLPCMIFDISLVVLRLGYTVSLLAFLLMLEESKG